MFDEDDVTGAAVGGGQVDGGGERPAVLLGVGVDELDVGVDWLRGDTTLGLGYSSSEEDDYEADSLRLSVAQEVFGGMSTLRLGFVAGDDSASPPPVMPTPTGPVNPTRTE